jgi:hypothetical protein
LKRLVTVTSGIPLEDVPASLHDRIMTRLAYAEPATEPVRSRQSRSLPTRTWAWAAFTTAAFAVACGMAQNRPGQPASGQRPFRVVEAQPTPEPRPAAAAPREVSVDRHVDAAPAAPDAVLPMSPHAELTSPDAALLTTPPQAVAAADVTAGRRAAEPDAMNLPVRPASEQPQPMVVGATGKPAMDIRVSEPVSASGPIVMVKEPIVAMPGEPIVNSTGPLGQSEPAMTMEKDATRMAGMAIEVETPGEEDEGLRTFRMFIQENSRMVPQPPTYSPGRERKKSL